MRYLNSTTHLLHQSLARRPRTTTGLHSAHHLNLKDSVSWMHLYRIHLTATASLWLNEADQWLRRYHPGSVSSLRHHHYLARRLETLLSRTCITLHSVAVETLTVFWPDLHHHLAQTSLFRSPNVLYTRKATARVGLCSLLVSGLVSLPRHLSTRMTKTTEKRIQIARRIFSLRPSMT